MTAELATVASPEDIAALPADQRGALITRALEESKSWLAVATKGTDPTPIAEFRAWAATVAEMTRQKGLANEIQLDALEMVRRAERGIGLAIRNGQEAGEIRKFGDGSPGPQRPYERVRNGLRETVRASQGGTANPSPSLTSPTSFGLRSDELTTGPYALADNVTDDQFEEALAEAREEHNLARANVVRKAKGVASNGMTRAQRAEKIRGLASQGYASRQMASRVGVSAEAIRDIAREHNIDIPADKIIGRTRHIDPVRVVRETVFALEGLRQGLGLLTPEDLDDLPPDLVAEWLNSLPESLRALQKLTKELKNRV